MLSTLINFSTNMCQTSYEPTVILGFGITPMVSSALLYKYLYGA